MLVKELTLVISPEGADADDALASNAETMEKEDDWHKHDRNA